MERLKKRWEIQKDWQLLFPILGALLLLGTAYMIARRLLHLFDWNNTPYEWPFSITMTLLGYWMTLRFFLWCFKKLENKWVVSHKWEMIVIFIVFAITGSISARLAQPLTTMIGLDPETTNCWLYWPIRIFIILPIYQVLLVCFGWLFGQFSFFWAFEKKMLKRMGLGFLFR